MTPSSHPSEGGDDSETDVLSDTEKEAIRTVVREELADQGTQGLTPSGSRRGLLKASGVGLAALAGGAGIATGSAAAANGESEETPKGGVFRDTDNDGFLETPKHDGIHALHKTLVEDADRGEQEIDRVLNTTGDMTLYVDPDGHDGNPGTQDAPLRTLTEAMRRVPHFIYHDVEIRMADGYYPEDDAGKAVHSNVHLVHGPGHFDIIGNPDDPSKVSVNGGFNGLFWGKQLHCQMTGVELNDLTQIAGNFVFWNCHLNGDEFRNDEIGAHGVGGYNPVVWLKQCKVGGLKDGEPQVEAGINASMSGGRIQAEQCEINATEAAVSVNNGGSVFLHSINEINAPNIVDGEPGTIVTHGNDLYVGGQKIT